MTKKCKADPDKLEDPIDPTDLIDPYTGKSIWEPRNLPIAPDPAPVERDERKKGTGFPDYFLKNSYPTKSAPCAGCGHPTMRFEWSAIRWVARSTFEPSWLPFCDQCDAARVAEQTRELARKRRGEP